MEQNTKLEYRKVGDYMIPNLILPPEAQQHIGKWGRLHAQYLNRNKLVYFTCLFAEGKLWDYLATIDRQAEELFDHLVEAMKKEENITEQLKATNQLEWVQKMNNIHSRATEIVNAEPIYV